MRRPLRTRWTESVTSVEVLMGVGIKRQLFHNIPDSDIKAHKGNG